MTPLSQENLEKLKHQKLKIKGVGCRVKVIGSDGKEQPGEVWIQSFNLTARIFRALKFLGICWGLAILSVFIPIAHFLLVPGFFIGGLIISYMAYGTESIVLGGESTCPNCGALLPIVRGKEEWPLTDLCSKCLTNVTIKKFTL